MAKNDSQLESPLGRRSVLRMPYVDHETVGRISERFARAMGTGLFLIGMTIFIAIWITWNTLAPADLQFDPRGLNFTLLTLLLSMQASYAAPLILLAQIVMPIVIELSLNRIVNELNKTLPTPSILPAKSLL